MAVHKRPFASSFILSVLILQLWLASIPQYEVEGAEEGRKRLMNPKKSAKMNPEKIKAVTNGVKTYLGQNTQVPSMVMLMESTPYYLWEYYSVGLIMSDTCVLIRAYDIADTYNDPPTLYTDYYHTIFIPRYGCDVQHHVREFVFNDPPYNYLTEANDIAIAKTKRKIQFGNAACGGQPVAPTWVSCDKNGPPSNYTECVWASYGLKTGEEPYWVSAPEEITPNANKIVTLNYKDCDASRVETGETIPFNPDDEICVTTLDGHNPYCPYDRNGALFCKYWNSPSTGQNSGGWTRAEDNKVLPNQNSGGWNSPGSDYVAVGHLTYYYGNRCPERAAALFVKYGSTTYRDLFNTDGCGFKCSSDLKPGEKCKGNPSPSLGPVYCIPESSGGWGEQPATNTGWSQPPNSIPNGWEETTHQSGWGAPSNRPPSTGWTS